MNFISFTIWVYNFSDVDNSILDYELLDLEIPTISTVGELVKARIPVLVYR